MLPMSRSCLSAFLGALAALHLSSSAAAGRTERSAPLLVFAATSLTDALEEMDRAFTAQTGIAVRASYGASSLLAKQIQAGAAADVFISADEEWMDYLAARGALRAGTRYDLLGNELVLIAPRDSTVQLPVEPGFPLAAALDGGRLAMADPESVPAGRYGQAALVHLKVWDSISEHLARAENVRAALAYVARGETPLGIVYRTDAQAEPRVRSVAVFPPETHLPIRYPVSLTAGARAGSERYLELLRSEAARRVFERAGFDTLR